MKINVSGATYHPTWPNALSSEDTRTRREEKDNAKEENGTLVERKGIFKKERALADTIRARLHQSSDSYVAGGAGPLELGAAVASHHARGRYTPSEQRPYSPDVSPAASFVPGGAGPLEISSSQERAESRARLARKRLPNSAVDRFLTTGTYDDPEAASNQPEAGLTQVLKRGRQATATAMNRFLRVNARGSAPANT